MHEKSTREQGTCTRKGSEKKNSKTLFPTSWNSLKQSNDGLVALAYKARATLRAKLMLPNGYAVYFAARACFSTSILRYERSNAASAWEEALIFCTKFSVIAHARNATETAFVRPVFFGFPYLFSSYVFF